VFEEEGGGIKKFVETWTSQKKINGQFVSTLTLKNPAVVKHLSNMYK
jgi:hypothetical protein